MSETGYADLPELAGHIRSVLTGNGDKRPDRSPFVLLYAFNGTGKTRLCAAFKDLGKAADENDEVQSQDTLYFNAFTEDLFSWDDDLENDELRTLVAQSGQVKTFHFNILRTILEKTALFLGHRHFSECKKRPLTMRTASCTSGSSTS